MAIVLGVLVATILAMLAGPTIARAPARVWAPAAGAVVLCALPGLGVPLDVDGLDHALLAHLHVPVLILALAYLSIGLDERGVFDQCSLFLVRVAGGDGRRLLLAVFVGVSAITYVTSNDIVILAMTPLLVHLGRNAGIRNLTPFLIAQFVAANTASMGLYIGNPTNVVIGGAAGLGFADYAARMFLPTLAATLTALGVIWLAFARGEGRHRIPRTFEAPRRAPRWTRAMTREVAVFAACLGCLAAVGNPWVVALVLEGAPAAEVNHGVGLAIAGVAVAFALLAAARHLVADVCAGRLAKAGLTRRARRLPVEILPFFLGFVVILHALDRVGLPALASDVIEAAFRIGPVTGSLVSGLGGVAAVNVVNNIPATLFFETLWLGDAAHGPGLATRLEAVHPAAPDIFVDASLVAGNVGANLTLVGALAGLMWLRILRDATSGDPSAPRVPSARDLVLHGVVSVPLVTSAACLVIAIARIGLG